MTLIIYLATGPLVLLLIFFLQIKTIAILGDLVDVLPGGLPFDFRR